MIRRMLKFSSPLLLAVLLFAFSEDAAAQTSIRSCYGKTSGQLRIPAAGEPCKSSETEMSWTSGEKGDKGDKGDPGPVGPAGPAGPPGDAGLTLVSVCDALLGGITDPGLRLRTCAANFGAVKFVFLSRTFNGSLAELNSGVGDGPAGADAKCQRDAQAAGLAGVYKAWLANEGIGPKDRMTHAPVPYVRPDFTVIADNWNAFASDTHAAGITLDASGNQAPGVFGQPVMAWTGATPSGDPNTSGFSLSYCNNWTTNSPSYSGYYGLPHSTNGAWTEAGVIPRCDVPVARLICVGQ
jgi:hypothetical protein